jgi:hypothetical protein
MAWEEHRAMIGLIGRPRKNMNLRLASPRGTRWKSGTRKKRHQGAGGAGGTGSRPKRGAAIPVEPRVQRTRKKSDQEGENQVKAGDRSHSTEVYQNDSLPVVVPGGWRGLFRGRISDGFKTFGVEGM